MGVYVYRDDKVEGPFDELVLQQALANGTLPNNQPCCKEGTSQWISAATLFRVHPTTSSAPEFSVLTYPKSAVKKLSNKPTSAKKAILICCSVIVGSILLLIIIGAIAGTSSNLASGTQASNNVRVETVLASDLQKVINDEKQKIFDALHPVGTANSAVLHDVTVTTWKHGQDTNQMKDIEQITFRYTIYWSGPITTDGYTKINETYDFESQRYGNLKIIDTNGMTKNDIGEAAGFMIGALIDQKLNGN